MTGAEPIWIEERDVLTLHDRLLAVHRGAEGVRDEGLLQLAAYGETIAGDWE
jgi:death-on-curing protein